MKRKIIKYRSVKIQLSCQRPVAWKQTCSTVEPGGAQTKLPPAESATSVPSAALSVGERSSSAEDVKESLLSPLVIGGVSGTGLVSKSRTRTLPLAGKDNERRYTGGRASWI